MAKPAADELNRDRATDRAELDALTADYLRQGGLVSQLDWAGNLVGLASPKPVQADTPTAKTAKVIPFVRPEPAPAAAPAPTPAHRAKVIDLVPELRRIRRDAALALARLEAAAERRRA